MRWALHMGADRICMCTEGLWRHAVPALEEHPAWVGWGVVCRQPVMLM